jgi:hypothetical protein
MKVSELKRYKLPEARYDTFTRKIVQEAIAKANDGKAVHIILRPEK